MKENRFAVNMFQFLILYLGVIVSLDCLMVYRWSTITHSKLFIAGAIVLVNSVFVLLAICLFYRLKKQSSENSCKTVTFMSVWKSNRYIFVTAVVYAVIAVFSFDTIPMYDASQYFAELSLSIDRISLNPASFLDAFSIIGKQMQFFSILSTPFLVVFKCNPIGIYILNTGLVILSFFAVDYILKEIFPELSELARAVILFIFGMFAYIYTGITYINPDFYCAVFFPILIYCYLKRYWLFFIYSSLVFCGMKSNMMATYCALFFVIWIVSVIKERKISIKLIGEAAIFAIPVLVNVFLKFARTVKGWSQQSTRPPVPIREEIIARLSPEFLFGFRWLILILVIITILVKWKKKKKSSMLLWAIPFASLIQLAVYIGLHKTKLSISPRYWSLDALMYAIGIGFVIYNTDCKIIKGLILIVITCVVSVQQFINIDPTVSLLCKKVPFEKRGVYIMVPKNYPESIGIGDSSSFNMQYACWNSIWRDFIQDGIVTKDTVIYSTVDNEHDDIAYKVRYGINGMDQIDWYIDSDTKSIVYRPGNNTKKMGIENLRSEKDVKALISKGNTEIVLFKPDTVEFQPESFLKNAGYTVVDERHYENRYTSLDVVVLHHGNIVSYGTDNLLHNENVLYESDKFVLNPGGVVFGPAEPIEAGTYMISFHGFNLYECLVDVFDDTNWYAIQYREEYRGANEIRLAVEIKEPVQRVEFRTFNQTSSQAELYSVNVIRIK